MTVGVMLWFLGKHVDELLVPVRVPNSLAQPPVLRRVHLTTADFISFAAGNSKCLPHHEFVLPARALCRYAR